MQKQLRTSKVALRIARYPPRFEVTLSKAGGKKLGFRFEKPQNQSLEELRITEVLAQGCVADNNMHQMMAGQWHLVILPEMRIEAVNGVEDNAEEIAQELRSCESA